MTYPHPPYRLGLDIGGTAIKAGLVSDTGEVCSLARLEARPLMSVRACRELTFELAEKLPDLPLAEDAGVAVAGAVDLHGALVLMPNIQLDPRLLACALEQELGLSCAPPINDADAAALGELGSRPGTSDLLLVTLGTGVGAGIVSGGRLLAGARGCAGELGHLKVAPEGRACSCGGSGCLERYCSASGLLLTYGEQTGRDPRVREAREVFAACRAGEAAALRAVSEMAETLGRGLAQACCLIDPELVVIGGGMGAEGDLYLDATRRSFDSRCLPPQRGLPIERARLGNAAGVVGAAAWSRGCPA